ncbi:D-hexose-6-phosphate mutarotase [Methylocaldum sp.]|uniref:D-hexose-6-phosphate mutarotase n=1 Tax=Methylocaldum sp. TaxID=1969727 RepID=UPI002D3B310B|nr:D-hexose-6-phosphate mutarotase [Methylocaldum sp.]HYE36360.1 D-hexose-6-phosphate mutarotase [Methylocaldum sp.]
MDPNDISVLDKRFGIAGEVVFKEGPSGLGVVEISNGLAMASIALQGAHLMSWAPHREELVIWLSPKAKFGPGEAIRGGVPVCWPWFGPHRSESAFPAHGFARTVPWEVIEVQALEDGSTRLGFRLIQNDETHAQWPHSTPLALYMTIGTALEMELVTHNLGLAPVTIGEALHTYFQVSDIRRIAIHGLKGCLYIDKTDDGRLKQQSGPVTFDGETDRIYLESTADCLIDDPGLSRRIRIAKRGSRSTVVWNPWAERAEALGDFGENGYLGMVCVESANAADDVVTIAPGGTHRLWVRYTVESMR